MDGTAKDTYFPPNDPKGVRWIPRVDEGEEEYAESGAHRLSEADGGLGSLTADRTYLGGDNI